MQSYAIATTGSPYTPAQLKAALVNNGDLIVDLRNSITKPRVNVENVIIPGAIVPDIKANGSDGPVTVQSGDPVSLEITLNAGSSAGTNADWWAVCDTPFDYLRRRAFLEKSSSHKISVS